VRLFMVLLIVLAAGVAWPQDYPGVVLTTGADVGWSSGVCDSLSYTGGIYAIGSATVGTATWGVAESGGIYISGFREVCDTFWTLHKGEFQALYDRLFVQEGKLLFLKNNTYGKGFYVEVHVIDSIECHTDTLRSDYITVTMPKPQYDMLLMMLWKWYDNNSDLVWGDDKWMKDISDRWEKERLQKLNR